jgi:serine/threonine-protein kinase RsbT
MSPDMFPQPLVNGQVKGKARRSLSPGEVERLPLHQPLDVAIARTSARKLAEDVGYSLIDQVRLSTVVFDLADIIITYAGEGEMIISWHEDGRRKGLKFFYHDQGRRAAPLTAFLQGKQTDAATPDLSTLKMLADEVEFIEDTQLGNCIAIIIWLE